jgi:hypothetical protein
MIGGKVVAGHVTWPAEIVPLWHGEEGKGGVVVGGFIGVGGDSVPVK